MTITKKQFLLLASLSTDQITQLAKGRGMYCNVYTKFDPDNTDTWPSDGFDILGYQEVTGDTSIYEDDHLGPSNTCEFFKHYSITHWSPVPKVNS
jgi:hypothetical protein